MRGRSSTQWGDVVEGVGGEWVGGGCFSDGTGVSFCIVNMLDIYQLS